MPFAPTDVSGCLIWLKADSLGLSDNDPISTWADSSGNGRDATQSGSKRPTFKTNILNGLPVVRCDGVDDYLATPSFTLYTLFAVARFGSSGNYPTYCSPFAGATVGFYMVFASGSTSLYTGGGTPAPGQMRRNGVLTDDNAPIDAWALLTVNPAIYTPPSSVWEVGRTNGDDSRLWTGDVAEIVAYDSQISVPDRDAVEAYLTAKWLTAPSVSATRPAAAMVMI